MNFLIRRLVPFVVGRPWLHAFATRAFAVAPSFKRRVRRMLSPAATLPPSRLDRPLSALEAGVLCDLQDAIEAREKARE